MSKKEYTDRFGLYTIQGDRNGSYTLFCYNKSNGHLDYKRTYKTEDGAKRALSRYCDGMPKLTS